MTMPLFADTSVINIECPPEQYSASMIARAVEDADAHLVSLSVSPGEGTAEVELRVTLRDPWPAVRSLERYGYEVVSALPSDETVRSVQEERLDALRAYLNV